MSASGSRAFRDLGGPRIREAVDRGQPVRRALPAGPVRRPETDSPGPGPDTRKASTVPFPKVLSEVQRLWAVTREGAVGRQFLMLRTSSTALSPGRGMRCLAPLPSDLRGGRWGLGPGPRRQRRGLGTVHPLGRRGPAGPAARLGQGGADRTARSGPREAA